MSFRPVQYIGEITLKIGKHLIGVSTTPGNLLEFY